VFRRKEAISRKRLTEALDQLERESRLVRRERRRDLDLYELTSEFLVPWIRRHREAIARQQQRRREARRLIAACAATLVALAMLGLTVWALVEKGHLRQKTVDAT
jgi:hypothetical protein